MFVCQDRTYSQIAEAWMHYLGNDSISITSSGLSAGQISQYFINVMDEVGVSVDKSSTKEVRDGIRDRVDLLLMRYTA